MKKYSTKKALIVSMLSLLLCVSMLVGTTFAWFTDSVASANNIIKSGNLDVELYYQAEGQNDWKKVTDTTNVFNENALWEPGYTEVVKLKVVNEGSLSLKYKLGVNVASEVGSVNVNDEEFKLSDFIKFGIVDGVQTYTRDQAIAAVDVTATALKTEYNSAVTALDAKNDSDSDEKIVTMVVYMPTSVGNDANAKTGAAVPTINLGINLFATQYTSESDSFGSDYDEDAPIIVESKPAEIPAEDVTEAIILSANDMKVELPANVINALPATVTSVSLVYSEPKTESNMLTFSSIDLVDQNDKVIDLEENTEALTVTLPAQTTFAAGTTVHIYHDGEYITTTTVNSDNTISYTTEHFCEVIVTTASGKVAYRPYILNGSRKAIQIDMENINASKSLVVELWHEDTLLTTTTYAGRYPYVKSGYTTCCVAMPGSAFFSWDTTIADGVTLTENNVPDMIKVYADGVLVNTFEHSSGTVFADKVNDYLAIIPE